MKNYDCIIVGDDIYALIIALFLTRKMRDILLINDSSPYKEKTESMKVSYNKKEYDFKYHQDVFLTGLSKGGLTEAFLDDLDLLNDIEYASLEFDHIIDRDGQKKIRANDFNDFKVYLMRYYPKSIKEIKKFFNDLERHYNNYREQYMNLLHNNDYTLSSLMVEWGDYSLLELLDSYFSDKTIIKEFKSNAFINGLDINKVSSYNFFANYFTGLKKGFYYLKTPIEVLRDKILDKIKLSSKHSIINVEITNIVVNDNRIDYIEDSLGNQYNGKYYFVSDQPIEFYNDYFPDLESHVKKLKKYYPYLEDTSVKRTMYMVFDPLPKDMGIESLVYYYQDHDKDTERIIKIFNYSMVDASDNGVGKICIDFAYDKNTGFSEDRLLDKLFESFPKLKWQDMAISYGEEKPYLAMIRDEKLRKKLSIMDLIDYETLNHISVYDNLYIGGSFIRPESSIYGKIHQSIVTADKIEDNLYFKEEDEEFYYSNEEAMMMLRQNFDESYFGKKEIHINFYIGKAMYFFRIKGKNVVIHTGRFSRPDLTIFTSNDRLVDLVFKRKPYKEIIDSNFFRWIGQDSVKKAFIKAFDLDDRHPIDKNFIPEKPFKYFGLAFINIYMLIVGVGAFLIHYVDGLIMFPSILALLGGWTLYKGLKVKEIYFFEVLMLAYLFVMSILSIFMDSINHFGQDYIVLAPMAIILYLSVIFNRPFVYHYLKFDYSHEFVHTKLFLSISNGISFLWGFILLSIIVGPFFTGERYMSVLYNFIIAGFFITYYYPAIYVNTSIKKT
jgi:hypothetical protein